MAMRKMSAAVGLMLSGCLMNHDVTCAGGGVRGDDGICRCPEDTMQEGRVCEEIDVGTEAGADSGEAVDEDSSAQDSEMPCGECDASPVEPDSGEDAGDAGADSGTDACVKVAWYADCDGDGYAVVGADNEMACEAPPLVGTCSAWTRTEPRAGATDCNDGDSRYRPGAGYGLAGDGDGDLDCDGEVEREGVLRECSVTPSGNGECTICRSSQECDCVFDLSGNPFPCSRVGRPNADWVEDFAWKTDTCTAILPEPVPRNLGLQYCR